MREKKKDFFYFLYWRTFVYTISFAFLYCFRAIALIYPKLNRVVDRYENGHKFAGAIIGFTSGLIPAAAMLLMTYENIDLSFDTIIAYFIVYILIGLLGWLALSKLREYDLEKQQ